MKETNRSLSIDPNTGFCHETKIYYNLRPLIPLLPETLSLSVAAHFLSLLHSNHISPENTTAFIDAATGHHLSYSQFIHRIKALSTYLLTTIGLSRCDMAFILSSFQLKSVVISPANPASTPSEISHQIELRKPVIAFTMSPTASKLPSPFRRGMVLLDSSDFQSMMMTTTIGSKLDQDRIEVNHFDPAAILYSSGMTGLVKGVVLSYRNLIALITGFYALRQETAGYGLTESAGAAARMFGPDEVKRYGSVGRVAENLEAKIVDPATGEPLPPGQRGELWLRGPIIMRGYAGDDKATASTLDPEGWLKTGDLCYFDSDGFLFIVDRLKELIKYKAYQVPSAELEHLLQSHPEIADAAVIPRYPDEDEGQIPMAYTVRKPGSNLTEAQVMDFIAKQVAPYKKIRRVAFINSIPKSPAGKILRRELVNRSLSASSAKL
ncbi:hypothetical protein NE237_021011 [Protea cynaroides]|uniref:Uncharacterized protein n=1 Tax=Protea cynaroides TaxID=273540 RepID=A0A9Q0H721_9MAGN|nr:hypothetical protein NE237_021011 [Protea cynaroides]